MKKPLKPVNEDSRQKALDALGILDTHAETAYDDLTLVASQICQTPIALITFIDKDRQWFKSKFGIDGTETLRDEAFCAHAILENDIMEIQNALKDERFFDNPYVTGDPNVRFYAGAPLILSTGEVLGTLCVIDRKPKKLDEAQKAALRTLARNAVMQMELRSQISFMMSREATLNRMVQQSIEEAKERSEFFARISHEVRAPMNGILGMLQALHSTELNDEQKECLNVARQSGEALLKLINDVLDLATIESGKMSLEKIDFDIQITTQRTTQLFSWLAKSKGIDLTFEGLGKSLSVTSDPTRISQIVTNLIANAIKFTNSGNVAVKLSAQPSVDSKLSRIEISVSDTGIGMTPETLKKIFDPFTQGTSSTHRQYGGTGLGLAISRNLATALNGKIECRSTAGQGSVFTLILDLPLGKGGTNTAVSPHNKIMNFSHARVLVAEDNDINAAVYHAFFKILGCQYKLVSDGQQAIQAVKDDTYDLILMDRFMPVCDGLEATLQIRKLEKLTGKRTPIIAISATTAAKDHELFLSLGMDDIMGKPVSMKELQSKLEKWIVAPDKKTA